MCECVDVGVCESGGRACMRVCGCFDVSVCKGESEDRSCVVMVSGCVDVSVFIREGVGYVW